MTCVSQETSDSNTRMEMWVWSFRNVEGYGQHS